MCSRKESSKVLLGFKNVGAGSVGSNKHRVSQTQTESQYRLNQKRKNDQANHYPEDKTRNAVVAPLGQGDGFHSAGA
jgi:hypothetical protein